MGKSRIRNTLKNVAYGYVSSMVTLVLNFISRTVFIYTLGVTFLGVNGLFSNVLGVLSLTELGIGTAMNYSLYRPVAEGNKEKIKSLLALYKVAYRTISLVICLLGLALIPFLNYLVKDPGNVGDLRIYYLIFLYNTCITYLVSYKFSLANADQKNYIVSNINTISNIITVSIQIVALLLYQNFFVYLLIAAVVGTAQKIFINHYLNRRYPFLLEKNREKLDKEETARIKNNVKALVVHKLGETSVYQTDNIIISCFINVTTVGLVSNYNLIITSVHSFIATAFDMVTSSFGNLMAIETEEKQHEIFKVYHFVGAWFFGFVSIAIFILASPFIQLWIGKDMVLPQIIVLLMTADYYFRGQRICINNVKTAGGVFIKDKYVGLMQGIVNLVVSVIFVKLIGLPGVYVGTLAQGLLASILRPVMVYKDLFGRSSRYYFKDAIKYAGVVALAWGLCFILSKLWLAKGATLAVFIGLCITVCVIPNILFYLCFRKQNEYQYIKTLFFRKKGEKA